MTDTLLDHLVKLYPTAKRTTLREMISAGRVRINGQLARTLKQSVQATDSIKVIDHLHQAKRKISPSPRPLPFKVVYEDEDILVIDKPAGILTSTVPREKRPTALAMIREYVAERDARAQLGLIHRLDRDASGLLVFSKNHEAYLSLKRQFLMHSVARIYVALVHNVPVPRKGTINSYLLERADGTVYSTGELKRGAERAVTHYETISHKDGHSLVRVKLETGKKHQIRAQLSERGVPIVNDPVYGEAEPDGRLMLAAAELTLQHPRSGKTMEFKADLPAGFEL